MSKVNQIAAALAATLGAFGLGTVLSWTSPALPDLKSHSQTFSNLSEEEESWIGSILNLGALFSAPVCGILMDAIGRKNTMLLLSVPFVLGWLLIGYAQNLAMMLIGRFVAGFCGGGFSLVAPVYIGETAEDSVRGALGSAFQLMVVNGILFVYVVGTFASWQWLALICGFVPVVFLIAMIFVPESPRHLLAKGKNAEASQALCWFRKKTSSQEVEDDLKIIETSVNDAKAQKSKFSDLFISYNLRPALIMLGLMLFQQLSGINAVIFYTVDIFESAGSSLDSNVSSIIVGVVQVAATLLSVFVVDRLGRRVLLLVSDVVMCISLVLLGLFFKLDDGGNADNIGWLPLVSLITFVIAFSIGFGPLPWMMLGELLPPKIKGLTASLATMFNWLLAFLVTRFFKNVLSALGAAWCYWCFAIVCAVGTVFVFIFVPETKGKSIEEIQRHFGGGSDVENRNGNNSSEPK